MPSGRTNNFPESGRGIGHVTPTIFGSTVGYPSDSLASCYSAYTTNCTLPYCFNVIQLENAAIQLQHAPLKALRGSRSCSWRPKCWLRTSDMRPECWIADGLTGNPWTDVGPRQERYLHSGHLTVPAGSSVFH